MSNGFRWLECSTILGNSCFHTLENGIESKPHFYMIDGGMNEQKFRNEKTTIRTLYEKLVNKIGVISLLTKL